MKIFIVVKLLGKRLGVFHESELGVMLFAFAFGCGWKHIWAEL